MPLKMTKFGMALSVFALVLVLAVSSLAYFKIVDLSTSVLSVLTIIGALFVMVEVDVIRRLKNIKKMDGLSIVGVIVAVLTLIGGIYSLVGKVVPVIGGALGILNALLVILIIIEAFR